MNNKEKFLFNMGRQNGLVTAIGPEVIDIYKQYNMPELVVSIARLCGVMIDPEEAMSRYSDVGDIHEVRVAMNMRSKGRLFYIYIDLMKNRTSPSTIGYRFYNDLYKSAMDGALSEGVISSSRYQTLYREIEDVNYQNLLNNMKSKPLDYILLVWEKMLDLSTNELHKFNLFHMLMSILSKAGLCDLHMFNPFISSFSFKTLSDQPDQKHKLEYFYKCLTSASEDCVRDVIMIKDAIDLSRRRYVKRSSSNSSRAVEYILKNRLVKVVALMEALDITRTAANAIVNKLQEDKFILRVGRYNNTPIYKFNVDWVTQTVAKYV